MAQQGGRISRGRGYGGDDTERVVRSPVFQTEQHILGGMKWLRARRNNKYDAADK